SVILFIGETAEVKPDFFEERKTSYPQGTQTPELVDRDVELDKSPVIQKELVCNLLCYLDKCIMLVGIHLRTFIELEEEFALSMICHQSWLIREVPDDWWLANVTPTHRRAGRSGEEQSGQSAPSAR
ncbi:hypothetical protein HGM15179_009712, partial [Zosterops borbonicus]